MSEESEPKPKLRLSRDPETTSAPETAEAADASEADTKVPRSEPCTPESAGGEDAPTHSTDGAAAKIKPTTTSAPETAEAADVSEADTKVPRSEPCTPESAGGEDAPTHSTDGAAAKIKPTKASPLASFLIIFTILLVLGGASGGIWVLLTSDQNDRENSAESAESTKADKSGLPKPGETASAPEAADPSRVVGPIDRAREAIAAVESAQGERPGASATNAAEAVEPSTQKESMASSASTRSVPEARPADRPNPENRDGANASVGEEAAPATGKQPGSTGPDHREAVTAFLRGAYIGAIRSGERARVMLNGESFNIGDTVHPPTGLVFRGTRDKQLLFQDRNKVFYLKSF